MYILPCLDLEYFYFAYFYSFIGTGNPTVTIGHLNFSIIFATIGLAIAIWAERWRIVVDGKQMEIHRLFHRPTKIMIPEIGKVMIGKKQQLTLYHKNGKKLITVDVLSDNYDKLLQTLKSNNVQIKNNDCDKMYPGWMMNKDVPDKLAEEKLQKLKSSIF